MGQELRSGPAFSKRTIKNWNKTTFKITHRHCPVNGIDTKSNLRKHGQNPFREISLKGSCKTTGTLFVFTIGGRLPPKPT